MYDSIFAILFFGTPHRGSECADAGLVVQRFADVLGFSTSGYNLNALKANAEKLENLRGDFAKMLERKLFYVTSFQESKGFKCVKGSEAKVQHPCMFSETRQRGVWLVWLTASRL